MAATSANKVHYIMPTGTLLGRIRWILQDREITHEQLSQRSGFTTRTQVSSVLSRLAHDPDYPSKMSLSTYEKLAKGGRVSLLWLVHGIGKPDESASVELIPKDYKFPNFVTAVRYEGSRWKDSTIHAVMAMPFEHDMDPKVWTEILDSMEQKAVEVYTKFHP